MTALPAPPPDAPFPPPDAVAPPTDGSDRQADALVPPPAFAPLAPEQEPAAADLLLGAMPGLSPKGAATFLASMRQDPDTTIVAAFDGERAAALYVLRKVGVTTQLLLVAADPAADPARGLEAAAVRDAGERVGRRPLTVETSERALAWYKGLGFKLVGKRRKADGSWGYRLGWHGKREGTLPIVPGAQPTAAEPCSDPAALIEPLGGDAASSS
jgi:hypothetical protein